MTDYSNSDSDSKSNNEQDYSDSESESNSDTCSKKSYISNHSDESCGSFKKCKPKLNKASKNNGLLKYTTDGLSESDYNKSDVCNQGGCVKSECCGFYFNADGYTHQTKYYFGIEGMNICIHCYFSFNIEKYTKCVNLNEQEIECLKYYIDNFTEQHNSIKCNRIKSYKKCLLCESKIGIKPVVCRDQNDEDTDLNDLSMNDETNILISDVRYVSTNPTGFVLTL